jgi:DNA-binding response OmpR family regulator
MMLPSAWPPLKPHRFDARIGETDHLKLQYSLANRWVEIGFIGNRLLTMTETKKQIIVYSDDSSVRASVISALGKRVAKDLPEHEFHEFATAPAMRAYIDTKNLSGGFRADLFILDGETSPEGGLGVARQLKDEVFNCPPVLVITGRQEDSWLAAWSMAEASVVHPIDPFTLAKTAAELLRGTKPATA